MWMMALCLDIPFHIIGRVRRGHSTSEKRICKSKNTETLSERADPVAFFFFFSFFFLSLLFFFFFGLFAFHQLLTQWV
jgi:hypothetical protein